MDSVTLETSLLGVRDGRVRGCTWSSSPRVPYGTGVVQVWRFLSSVSDMWWGRSGWCRGEVKVFLCKFYCV